MYNDNHVIMQLNLLRRVSAEENICIAMIDEEPHYYEVADLPLTELIVLSQLPSDEFLSKIIKNPKVENWEKINEEIKNEIFNALNYYFLFKEW